MGISPETVAARVDRFPVDLIQQALALKNPAWGAQARTLLGPFIDMQVEQKQLAAGMELEGAATTSTLRAHLKGIVANGSFSLTVPGQVSLTIPAGQFDLAEPIRACN